MKKSFLRKIFTFISVFSIIAQSLTPYAVLLPQQVSAQEIVDQTTPTETQTTVEPTTPQETPTPTSPQDQITPTETVTPTPTEDPALITPTPTEAVTPTDTKQVNNNSPPSENQNNNSSTPIVTPEVSIIPTLIPENPTGDEQLNLVILDNISAPSIDLEAVESQGSAVLTTDKPDYAPTDTALITGYNLLSNTTYILRVWSDDEPPTGVSTEVASDTNGVLAYAYQLDGTYRPNYKAELRDREGNVVASTTFTDTDASIAVEKTASDSSINQGDTAIYTIKVSAGGATGSTAQNTILTDQLPVGTWILGGADSGSCSINGSNLLTCNFGDLPKGASKTITISQNTSGFCGEIKNNAHVEAINSHTGGNIHDDDNNNKITVECADVTVEKSGNDINVNGDLIWEIDVKSVGGSIANSVTLSDVIPNVGVSWVIISQPSGSPCTIVGNTLTCNFGNINDGVTKTVRVKANNVPNCGLYSNTATVAASNENVNQQNNNSATDDARVRCSGPDVTVTKTGNGPIDIGDEARFTIVVENIGAAQASSVTLVDNLPSGVNWSENSSSCSISGPVGSEVLNCNFGAINAGDDRSVVVKGDVDTADCPSISNTVTVASTNEAVAQKGNNSASATIDINGCAPTTGTVTIHKNVLDAEDSDISDSHQFTVKKDGSSAQPIAEGGTDAIYTLTPGAYTFTEDSEDDYTLISITGDNDSNASNGVTVTVVAGQNTELTFVNKQVEFKICHSAGGSGNYVEQSESPSGIFNGHLDDDFGGNTNHQNGNDIIPPFTYQSNTYSQNWDAEGQAIWNNDCNPVQGTITFHKIVDGGTAVADDWTFTVNENDYYDGSVAAFDTGTYGVTESGPSGYTLTSATGACSLNPTNGAVTLDVTTNGGTCTITNTRDTGNLKARKIVNDQSEITLWSFQLDNGSEIPVDSNGYVDFGQVTTLDTHTIVEIGPTGSYTLDQVTGQDCTQVSTSAANATVEKDEETICTFSNQRDTGTIEVVKDVISIDPSDNSEWDMAISGLTNNNDTLSDEETTGSLSSLTGQYEITESAAEGTDGSNYSSEYECVDASNDGEFVTGGSGRTAQFTLEKGQEVVCTFTNTRDTGTITVNKEIVNYYNDTDPGKFDLQVNGVTEALDQGDGGTTGSVTVITGTHSVGEVEGAGTSLSDYVTSISCDDENGSSTEGYGTSLSDIQVYPGDNITCTITNTRKGKVILTKYNDVNGDGKLQEGEGVLSGWTMNLDKASKPTLEDGTAIFDNLIPGYYYNLSEDLLNNSWEQTSINCDSDNYDDGGFFVYVGAGQTVNCSILNHNKIPNLTISKSNDAGGNKAPGDTVEFKITINASDEDGPADNVKVTDLLPKGFTFNSSSWKVVSSDLSRGTGGDITSSLSTPNYASPGTWNLGHLNSGETLTLTYTAKIDGGQQTGTYYDNAWGQGNPVEGSTVIFARAINPGDLDAADPSEFVGTEVSVVNGDQGGVDYKATSTQEVLGASTSILPATGENTLFVIIATLLMGLGFGTALVGIKLRKKYE